VHLDRNDPAVPAFVSYLRALSVSARRIVLMGDLFNLWIAAKDVEQEHHRVVTSCLAQLRSGGTEIHYLEGNRDYRIAGAHAGRVFDAVSDVGLREDWGSRTIWAAHGDLVNRDDLQYRTWRRVSRSTPFWWLFSAIPRRRRFAIAESIESRMRATNVEMKREFPEALLRAYAAEYLGPPGAAVVLGHFHVEKELHAGPDGTGRIFVLPEWKGTRRHLRVAASGEMAFEDA
jgi:UDP-2,3-diacylglucosamine pyrophosphatase LpxH